MTFMFTPWWSDGRITHEELLAGLAAAGVEGIEPFDRDFLDEPALLPRYRQALADNGLTVPAVDVICNLVYADATQKQEGRERLRRGLEVCQALGTEVAHVAGHRLVEGVAPEDGKQMIADGLAEAAELVRADGIVMAIENFGPAPTLICRGDDCLDVLQRSHGAVKFVFDTGNFVVVKQWANEQFDLLADYICHCHFKDFVVDFAATPTYKGCDLGAGDVPNAAVAAALTARGYDGWVALETRGREDVDPVSAVRQELPLLRSWFEA